MPYRCCILSLHLLPSPAQVEVPAEIRHEGGEEVRSGFARDLAKVLAAYMDLHYGPPLHFSV